MKDGKRWYVFLRYKDWTGKTRQHKKEGFPRKGDALAYEREFRQRVSGAPGMTVKALYTLYMEDCRSRLRVTTVRNKDKIFLNHVLPPLGSIEVSSLTPATVRKWQNQLIGKGLKQSTLKMINAQLSALLNFGVKYYGLKSNPCALAGAFGSLKTDGFAFLTREQFEKVLAHVRDDTSRTLFYVLFWTGLRVGEALALTPADIDLTIPSVQINKTYHRINSKDVYTPPKTEGSNRTVILTDKTAEALQAHMEKIYGINKKTRIFAGRSLQSIRLYFSRACKAAGVPQVRIHDLRHSHASMMIELGFSPLLIAERLGHDNVSTTLKTYAHLYPNKQIDLVERLNRL